MDTGSFNCNMNIALNKHKNIAKSYLFEAEYNYVKRQII